MKKAVFLDRDGVINEEGSGYIGKLADFKIIPGSLDAIKSLHQNGYLVFVISNQSGVGRGYYSKEDVLETTAYLKEKLGEIDGRFTEIHYCFHKPEDNCNCRKPNPEVLYDYIKKYDILPSESFFISDTKNDLEMAAKADVKTIWINTNPSHPKNSVNFQADYETDSLGTAAKYILG